MNPAIEALYPEIGEAALAQAGISGGTLLVFAEIEAGATSTDLFYSDGAGPVIFKIASAGLREKILALWEKWRAEPGNSEWRCMIYVIRDGKFSIDFLYPDQVDDSEDPIDRRTAAAEKIFGNAAIDYSDPGW